MWGARLAVPLEGTDWSASFDDVRSLVDAIHKAVDASHPQHDYFLNLLGTGVLAGPHPRRLAHLKGRVVILGSYKIRQPHVDALEYIKTNGEGVLKALAAAAREIERHKVRNCVDVLAPEVRGGPWCWSDARPEDEEVLAQEHRAWVHIGATPRDVNQDRADKLAYSLKRLADLEAKHGGTDPASWRWGEGTPAPTSSRQTMPSASMRASRPRRRRCSGCPTRRPGAEPRGSAAGAQESHRTPE